MHINPTNKMSTTSCIILLLLASTMSFVAPSSASSLRIGFYSKSCPSAEQIVRNAVIKVVASNPGIGAGLIRMHFHDCFVRGCDGSVLLKSTPENKAERDNRANFPSLRGFEVIDDAKARIEAICPQTVSCADILAFAARDSSYKLGLGINYGVPAGRRDGRVSISVEAEQNLPPPFFTAEQSIANFERKGLTADEMVTLSGSHSVGNSHCTAFTDRLYPNDPTNTPNPPLNPNYATLLKTKCPLPVTSEATVALDSTPNRLDNRYYIDLKNNRGVLNSDQALLTSNTTRRMVENNARNGLAWANKFAKAMVRMGGIDVVTGTKGEIRKQCSIVN